MQQNILELLTTIISYKSISKNTEESKKLLSYIETYINHPDLIIEHISDSDFDNLLIYSRHRDTTKPFRILCNAHIDVVPAPDELFKINIEGDKAYGRGVYDMKGAASVMIEIFKQLTLQHKLPDDIGLSIVSDEEIGGDHGTKLIAGKDTAQTNFFLGGEPTDFAILTKHKGIMSVKIIYHGKAAHGSRPWLGDNAIIHLSHDLTEFYQKNPIPQNEIWETTYSANLFSGGSAFNIVADQAEVTFDIRYVETDAPEKILEKIKQAFPQGEIIVSKQQQGISTNKESKEIQRLSKIIEKDTQKGISWMDATYSTDAKYYNDKNIPSVHLGPLGGNMHETGEWLDVSSLTTYYHILEEFLTTL